MCMSDRSWRLVRVPADGRCALHATAVACNDRDATAIRHELIEFYAHTPAMELIERLYNSGDFMQGDAHVANPIEFRDFILHKNRQWMTTVLAIECDVMRDLGCPGATYYSPAHDTVVTIVRTQTRHTAWTVHQVASRCAGIFVHDTQHWHALLPSEHVRL